MLPFIVSVACNNGEFNDYTCFAEAWLRATHNGEPTGAIGAFMSTVSQSWDPPMQTEDEFNDILVGTYPDNIKTTYGALCFHGCFSMNDNYGADGWYETDAWTVFGDPSLQVRTATPAEMIVTQTGEIEQTATSYEVTVTDVAGALCALSQNYNLLGFAYTDETGHAIIGLTQPIQGEQALDLVVTAFNKMPYMTQVNVITNNPPNKPETPTGPAKGMPGIEYLFSTQTTDIDGDQIFYMWSWGDGNYSSWLGPINSGDSTSTKYSWAVKGTYQVKVKARDVNGDESDWSDPISISVPRGFSINSLLLRFFEQFPNAFPILRQILNI